MVHFSFFLGDCCCYLHFLFFLLPKLVGAEESLDNGFLQDLDASIKGFVGALVKFKTAKEKGEKDNYLPTANGLTEEAMSIAKKVMQAPLFPSFFISPIMLLRCCRWMSKWQSFTLLNWIQASTS